MESQATMVETVAVEGQATVEGQKKMKKKTMELLFLQVVLMIWKTPIESIQVTVLKSKRLNPPRRMMREQKPVMRTMTHFKHHAIVPDDQHHPLNNPLNDPLNHPLNDPPNHPLDENPELHHDREGL